MLKSVIILTLVLGYYGLLELAACPTYPADDPDRSGICNFQLYKDGTSEGEQIYASCRSIVGSSMNAIDDTTILVNGAANADEFLSDVRRELFKADRGLNLISVDWKNGSEYNSDLVPRAGICLANLINAIIAADGPELEQIHIVGFSLGAHVAGDAGRRFDREIARITGLDPSRKIKHPYNLQSGDAKYVELIHTDGGPFGNGIGEASGDADFFANNGKSQPGCFTHSCCHKRAYQLFAESLKDDNELEGRRCESKAQVDLNLCRGLPRMKMGNNDLNKRASGMYRVNTK